MTALLLVSKKCPECGKAVPGSSGVEAWHDERWTSHHRTSENCTAHGLCRKAIKEG